MAAERRTRRYSTYGSVAYKPVVEESAVRAPARPGGESQRRPQVQPRERVAARPSVQVREREAVSIFAIVGFAAVALCVFMLLRAGAQLAIVADQTFDLQTELSELQTEERKLQAQYEQAYDLAAIEQSLTASGAMVKASSANTVYLDLSEADSVIYYSKATSGLAGLVDRLEEMFGALVS